MSETGKSQIEVLLREKRVFHPSEEFKNQTNVMKWMHEHGIKNYQELLERSQDLEWFWAEAEKTLSLEWAKPYEKILEGNTPGVRWFTGGKFNIAHNALDRHVKTWRKDKVAYFFEGEPGDIRILTYGDVYAQVNRFANALKGLGIRKGDRVSLYLPMLPELPIAMCACAKIGAVHNVVFSGFSASALKNRIEDSEAKVLLTCDGYWRRGVKFALKKQADEALTGLSNVKHTIVLRRTGDDIPWDNSRDLWWHELTKEQDANCECECMNADDMLYILYTSGTTGKPKGVVHVHAGYAVGIGLTMKWVFDIKDTDIWWCTADIGWVTGHSYVVYAPMILGATSVIYEGAPDYPTPDRWWSIAEKFKVTILYTTPTALRLFLRFGSEWPRKHDLSCLRLLGTVGEPINPDVWMWYHENIGGGKCPIMDTWWQTETGSMIISPLPIAPLKPGSVTLPLPGFSADVYDEEEGKPITNAGGKLVLTKPWPAMFTTLYKDRERYLDMYWKKFPGVYLAGDVARRDEEGYFWIQGRADDVLKISGHRIGNIEIECALVAHPHVAEAAVVGRPHAVKGESIVAFVVLKKDIQPNEALRTEIKEYVVKEIGKIARPDELLFVQDVPKTRSGKIMRRLIRAKMLGQPIDDTSTLANPEAVEEIARAT